ncbi:Bacteriophage Lambda NinG protein [compost metagenome]
MHNAAAACVRCNRNLSGNIVELRKGLVARIGEEKVEAVERDHSTRKFSVDYLKRLKAIFTKKAKRLEKRYEEAGSWAAM